MFSDCYVKRNLPEVRSYGMVGSHKQDRGEAFSKQDSPAGAIEKVIRIKKAGNLPAFFIPIS
jgi:hypothetical protein